MATRRPRLPDTIRAKDPEAREGLQDLLGIVQAMAQSERLQAARMTARNRLMRDLNRGGVSCADLARVTGISDVSVYQAIQRIDQAEPVDA